MTLNTIFQSRGFDAAKTNFQPEPVYAASYCLTMEKIMLRILLLPILSILACVITACGAPHYVDYFPYHDDGTLKPKVALIPIIDSSSNELSWNVSEELSQGVFYQLMDSGEFYVPSPKEIGPVWGKVRNIDFFNGDFLYAQDFHNTDFIVAMELIEHSTSPSELPLSLPSTKYSKQCVAVNRQLTARIRIKIIDIRCNTPKTVLYEVFKTSYALAPSKNGIDCTQITWQTEGYDKTPCGIAHERLIRNLAARLEEVIWSVK